MQRSIYLLIGLLFAPVPASSETYQPGARSQPQLGGATAPSRFWTGVLIWPDSSSSPTGGPAAAELLPRLKLEEARHGFHHCAVHRRQLTGVAAS